MFPDTLDFEARARQENKQVVETEWKYVVDEDYRMAHLNEAPEPVATLVASNKVQCIECVDPTRVSMWVENHAATDRISPRATNCVSQQVIVNLQKTPEAKRLTEFYKQAITTCGL